MRSFYLSVSIVVFSFSARAIAADAASKTPACQPFSIHSQAEPPYQWKNPTKATVKSSAGEERLVQKISNLPGYGSFLDSYLSWKKEQKSARMRVERLDCILFYAQKDTDGDGLPDWQAVIDRRPSAVLYPRDDDIDGDGSPNMLDPSPFDPKKRGSQDPIPAHLLATEKKLQKQLKEKFGILAIDHSDGHSPEVLANLLFLLENGPAFLSRLKNFRYLYAFAGHDREVDIAAYHHVAKAISIGGANTFSTNAAGPNPIILAALAHEIGHALLMEKISAAALSRFASEFGGWDTEPGGDLYSAHFFRAHPLHGRLKENRGRRLASTGPGFGNLVSSYSTTNIHEWFAETFAASILVSLGEQGLLGAEWRKSLITVPKSRRHHWTDYNNISPGLRAWFGNLR